MKVLLFELNYKKNPPQYSNFWKHIRIKGLSLTLRRKTYNQSHNFDHLQTEFHMNLSMYISYLLFVTSCKLHAVGPVVYASTTCLILQCFLSWHHESSDLSGHGQRASEDVLLYLTKGRVFRISAQGHCSIP